MSVAVGHRYGIPSDLASIAGVAHELIIDTTNNRVLVMDGVTPGGFAAAKLSEVSTLTRRAVADIATTIVAGDRMVAYTSLTASRTVTLCAASAFPVGGVLWIIDETGACSSANPIIVNRAGSDTVSGNLNVVLNGAYMATALESNGVNAWTILTQIPNVAAAALGIGTAPDTANPLAVKAATALFNALTSDFRVIVNKVAAANTASFLFQDGFSGRAEIGLVGDDNFHFRTSPNGSTYQDAIILDKTTAIVTLSAGKVTAQFGTANVGFGTSALIASTTGTNNSAFGVAGLAGNTTGSNNSAFGASALLANVAGAQNSAVGSSALADLNGAAANSNTAVGYNTGRGVTTGANNTILGAGVTGLATGLTGAIILATGDGTIRADYGKATAGFWTLTGGLVATAGTLAAPAITLGDAATGLYRPALNSIGISVNGANPVIIDSSGRISAGFGTANLAVGTSSLTSNTTGQQNAAFGASSLSLNTTGSYNLAIGTNSLSANTTGSFNTSFGTSALASSSVGSNNSAFGTISLYDLNGAAANNNTAVGYNTGRGITTGTNNTILGANVTGLAAGLASAVILATGDGTIRADYGKTTAGVWTVASPVKTAVYTVATLPSAASATAGARAFVTDALTPAFGATVVAGGAVNVPVYSDGTNWKVG